MELLEQIFALGVFAAVLMGCYKIVSYTHRNLGRLVRGDHRSLIFRIASALISCIIGAVLASISWHPSESQLFIGVPFPVAVFQLRDGRWSDFVSPISILLWIFDAIFWIGIFHLLLAIAIYWKSRKVLLSDGEAARK